MAAGLSSSGSRPPTTGRMSSRTSRSRSRPGSITCLLGSNGSGKTTLIRSILGLTPPRSGRIRSTARDLTGLPTHR